MLLDLNLGDRAKALDQLGVEPAAHAATVSMGRDVLPEHEAGLLIGSRQWPLLAARMQQVGDSQDQKPSARTWPAWARTPPGSRVRPPRW